MTDERAERCPVAGEPVSGKPVTVEPGAGQTDPLDQELRDVLSAISREETPERLLDLARDLQTLIRKRDMSRA